MDHRPDNVAADQAPAAPPARKPPAVRRLAPNHYVERSNVTSWLTIRDNLTQVWEERLGKVFRVPSAGSLRYEQATFEQFKTTVERFCTLIAAGGAHVVAYKQHGKFKTGRRFAEGLSFQGLHRQIRHAVAGALYHDLDIKNAHPTFAVQLARDLGVAHPLLNEWVAARDGCIQRWIGTTVPRKSGAVRTLDSFGAVKDHVLKLLNGGGRADTSNAELNAFHAASAQLLDRVYVAKQFRNFRRQADDAQAKKEYKNPKGTCISLVLCDIENRALLLMEECAAEVGAVIGALCFDGLMIEKTSITPDCLTGLLAEMSRRVSEALGYAVQVVNKPMDEAVDLTGLAPNPDAEPLVAVELVEDVELETTDEALAHRMLSKLEERGILHDAATPALYVFDPPTALWKQRDYKYLGTLVSEILTPWALAALPDRDGRKLQVALKGLALQSRIVACLTQFVRARSDSVDRLDRSPGLFPIADRKTIDLRTGETRDRVRDDYFTKATPRRLVALSAEDRTELLNYFEDVLSRPAPTADPVDELLLDEPAPTHRASTVHRDALISFCAYVLSGENNLKLFANLIGERDAGKSLFLELLGAVCGDFHCTANARLFVEQRNQACHDSELFNLRGRRMAYLSETSGASRFNEDLIKRISGGDRVNIRGAGEKQTVDELFSCVLMLATNNVCQFSDAAFMSRLACFNFSNSFARDATVKDRMMARVDQFFTLIVEYAQRFYEAGRKIVLSPEVLAYTTAVIEEQDTTAVWCREQANFIKYDPENPTHAEGDFYIVKADLFEEFHSHWRYSQRKYDGKIKFFRRFEQIYGLAPATKIRLGHEVKAAYRGIKQVE